MKEKIIEKLLSFGLTQKQAITYLACLEAGDAQVGTIVKATDEKRTTVYAVLQELVRRGLITSIKSGNKYIFSPKPPSTIISLLEEQKQDMKELLPFLDDIFSKEHISPNLEVFYGKQIVYLFDKILKSKEKKLFMMRSGINKSKVIGKEFHFGKNRRKKNIFAKVLLSRNTPKLKDDLEYFKNQKERLREVRLLPADLDIPSDMFIFDDTVCTIAPGERFGFCVQSADFSKLMKNIFNTLWELSKKTSSV